MYRYGIFAAVLFTVLATSAWSKDPPRLRGTPPSWTPGDPAEDRAQGRPTPGIVPPLRDPDNVSSMGLPQAVPPNSHLTPRNTTGSSAPTARNVTVRQHNLKPTTLDVPSSLNPLYSWPAMEAGDDVEPTTIAITQGGTTYHFLHHAHYNGTAYQLDVRTATTLTHVAQPTFTTTPLTNPGYREMADPCLAENPYSVGIGAGRVYAAGMLFNRFDNDRYGRAVSPSQIRLYYRYQDYSGNWVWTAGTPVDYRALSSDPLLDKPSLDVSWFTQTLGYIFVAYVELAQPQRIHLRWNTDGLFTRCRPAGGGCDPIIWHEAVIVEQPATSDPHGPQVVVNSANGDVYVLWSNAANEIRMRRAPYNAADPTNLTFGPEIVVANNFTRVTTLGNGMWSPTKAFQARYNPAGPAANSLMVTWHATATGTLGTAVFYTSFNGSTIQSGDPVPARRVIDATGDQFQAAADNDNSGGVLLSYYSTQNDTVYAYRKYQLFGVYLNADGTLVTGPALLNSTFNEFQRTEFPHPAIFNGDYRDTFYWSMGDIDGNRWETAWIHVVNPDPNTNGDLDPWITGVR